MMHLASEYFMSHLVSQTKASEAVVLVCFSAAALADLFFPALPLCYSRLMFPEPFLLLSLFIYQFIYSSFKKYNKHSCVRTLLWDLQR